MESDVCICRNIISLKYLHVVLEFVGLAEFRSSKLTSTKTIILELYVHYFFFSSDRFFRLSSNKFVKKFKYV